MAIFLLPHTIPKLWPPGLLLPAPAPGDGHVLSWDFCSDLSGLWHEVTEEVTGG